MEPIQLEAKNLSPAGMKAEMPISDASNLHGSLSTRFQSAGEIASARQFFAPTTDLKIISPQAGLPGLEHTTAAAVQAANQTISPLLQLIMRLPSHVSIFGSFLEAMKSFFLPHTDVLTQLIHVDASGLNSFSHSLSSLTGHHPGFSIMPAHAHIFQNMALDGHNVTAHLHLNAADSLKHSMNVSAGPDLQNPQFEKLPGAQLTSEVPVADASNLSANASLAGDSLAGPGISAQTIAPQVAPAERIFTSRYLEAPGSNAISSSNNLLASNQPVSSANDPSNNLLADSQNVSPTSTNNDTIASANIPSSPTFNQVPTANDVVNVTSTTPIEGLHAKALSLSGSHHVAHSIANHAKSHAPHIQAQKQESTAVIQSGPAESNYVVRSGDTLWHIADSQLGDGMRWSELYSMNKDIIGSNPGMIYPGQKFDLSAHLSDGVIAHHPASHVVASAPTSIHSVNTAVSNLHSPQPLPKPEVHTAAHTVPHTMPHAEPVNTTLAANTSHVQPEHHTIASNIKAAPENVIAPHPQTHPQISMHTNTNNGLAIENAHDRLLSGAGSAQANTVPQNSVISKAANNLAVGKLKPVVSFSLAPDLSFLSVVKR